MKNSIFIGTLSLLLASCIVSCQKDNIEDLGANLTACTPCPVALTSSAVAVSGDKAYLFGGRNTESQPSNHLYCYTADDQWTDLGAMPLANRVNAIACAAEGDLYLGLGFSGSPVSEYDSCYLQDFWRYRPSTGEWTRLADYPTIATAGAVAFQENGYIYVCYGSRRQFIRDTYVYSIADNTWTKMEDSTGSMDFPPRALGCTGAQCGNRMFVGTGFHTSSLTFWVELTGRASTTDGKIWRRCHSLPGKGRNAAAATADNQYIYVAGGRYYGGTVTDGMLHDDILRYDPATDTWAHVCSLPQETENMVAFTLSGHTYFGLGNDKYNHPLNTLYKL